MKRGFTAAIAFLFAFSHSLYAEESASKPKSVGVAWALAFDPIPGDTLFYSGHILQGSLNAFIGVTFAAAFGILLAQQLKGENCDPNSSDYLNCVLSEPTNNKARKGAIGFAGSVYIGTLIWDGILGVHYVKQHNREISKHAALWESVRPRLEISSAGPNFGFDIRF